MANLATTPIIGALTSSSLASPSATTSTGPGTLSRFYRALIAHQQARATSRVSSYLGRQDDAALARLGYSADDIARIRGSRRS